MEKLPELKIMAEPQADPQQCKFTLNVLLFERGIFIFDDRKNTKGSALADFLFEVESVEKIAVAPDHIIVTVAKNMDWRTVGKQIGTKIREAIASGKTLISEESRKKTADENDLIQKVKQILTDQVNPAVASHGGAIELLDVRGHDVYLKMSGGCQGCGMAAQTLRQGVENTLREKIPNLGAVYDTTIHEEGKNPYY